jgi:hypothetical protein
MQNDNDDDNSQLATFADSLMSAALVADGEQEHNAESMSPISGKQYILICK